MGLGLPIVKKVADSLSAHIKIESNPPEYSGTTISIIFNRYKLPESKATVEYPDKRQMASYQLEQFDINEHKFVPDRPLLLLIEDNHSMLKFLSKKLSNKYNVLCSLNGVEALKKLRDSLVVPDLILSDIMMDKMDGFAFAKIISEQTAFNHIPILFLSARSTPSDKLKGLRLGAIDLIQKPFSFEVLNQKIEAIIQTISKQKRAFLNSTVSNLKVFYNSEKQQAGQSIDQTCKLYNLTAREREIAELILRGSTYKTIGRTLFIAEKTVSKHAENIFRKTGASNKIELINKISSAGA
jgi:DNA-binding NarL/FixJ family response regulator